LSLSYFEHLLEPLKERYDSVVSLQILVASENCQSRMQFDLVVTKTGHADYFVLIRECSIFK